MSGPFFCATKRRITVTQWPAILKIVIFLKTMYLIGEKSAKGVTLWAEIG